MVVTLPPGFVRVRGLQFFLHDCGAIVSIAEVPPALGGLLADVFWRGVSEELAATSAHQQCREERGGLRICRDGTDLELVRRLVRPEGRAVVMVHGPMDEATARAIAASAVIDASLPFDPVAATGVFLATPEGMRMMPMSSAGVLQYADAQAADPFADDVATIRWSFTPWGVRHADGSPWPIREMAEHASEIARDVLGMTAVDTRAGTGETDEDGGIFTMPGMRGAVPVTLLISFLRDVHGVWTIVAAVPTSSTEPWMDRFAAQVATFSYGD